MSLSLCSQFPSILGHTPSLLSLSDEVLVYILSLLSSQAGDLLSCSLVHSRLQRLVWDRRVVDTLHFHNETKLTEETFKRFVRPGLCVRRLSLASCYWLSPAMVTSSLTKLTGLTSLSLVEVRLRLKQVTSLFVSLPLLTHLGFTWQFQESRQTILQPQLKQPLAQLKSLLVHLATSPELPCPLDTLTHLLSLTEGLQSLMVVSSPVDLHQSSFPNRFNVTVNFASVRLPFLRRLVLVLTNSSFPDLMVEQFVNTVTASIHYNTGDLEEYWLDTGRNRGNKSLERIQIEKSWIKIDLDNWIPKKNLCSLRDITTVYCTMSGCRLTQLAHLGLAQEVQHLLELHVQCKRNSHVNTKTDNSIFSIEDSDSLEDNSSRKLFTLTDLPFTRLSKLTSPLCALLEEEKLTTDLRSCPTGSRISHKYNKNTNTTNGASYTNVHLQQFGRDVQSLTHLRVHSSCRQEFEVSENAGSYKRQMICNPDGSQLLESIPQFKNLQTLVLSEIKFDFTNVHHFPAIFTSCANIEELHCQRLLLGNHLKFCKDLSTGLQSAAKLRILKLQQCGISQYYPLLLEGLQKGSKKLEQLVIVTPSDLGLTKKVKFPIKQTVDLVKSCSKLFFIYLCSEALVKKNVKELRTGMKMIKEERKNLVYCFHKPEKCPPYYRLSDLCDIPGFLLDSVLSLDSRPSPADCYKYQNLVWNWPHPSEQ